MHETHAPCTHDMTAPFCPVFGPLPVPTSCLTLTILLVRVVTAISVYVYFTCLILLLLLAMWQGNHAMDASTASVADNYANQSNRLSWSELIYAFCWAEWLC